MTSANKSHATLSLKSLVIRSQQSNSNDEVVLTESPEAVGVDSSDTEVTDKVELQKRLGLPILKVDIEMVGDSLAHKICPIQLQDKTWAILSIQGYTQSELIAEVKSKCLAAGAKQKHIEVITVTPYVILQVRNQGGEDAIEISADDDSSGHITTFTDIIRYGIERSASDVHLNVEDAEEYSQIRYTIEGQYTAPKQWRIETSRLLELINVAWQKSHGGGAAVFSRNTEQQCSLILRINGQRIKLRWASLAADRGVSVTLRLLKMDQRTERRSLESQGFMPSQIAMFLRAQNAEGGAIVIAGVVNSGKSTALAELMDMIPASRKVITLEDPVEYYIKNALQNTVVRSLDGNDDQAFTSKLKTFKRSAGNDFLLGEIRDSQTGDAFMDITGSGSNFYTTVHAKSNVQIPERLSSKSIGVPVDFLASPGILNLLVYMALVPVLCPHCAKPISSLAQTGGTDRRGYFHDAGHWAKYIARIERLFNVKADTIRIKNDEGCSKCKSDDLPQLNGYGGRTAVASMLEPQVDRGMLRYIRDNDTLGLQEYVDRLQRTPVDHEDMTNKPMMEVGMYKVLKGLIDPRDIEQKTMAFDTYELMKERLRKAQ